MIEDSPGKILVVDDEAVLRHLLSEVLGSEGYAVKEASDGQQACSLAAAYLPDLILLDIMMPGMTGYQVAAQLKSDGPTREIPIVMVTALDDRESKQRAMQLGAAGFLTKPINFNELLLQVKKLMLTKA